MFDLVLQGTIDIDTPGVTGPQMAIAALAMVIAAAGLVLLVWRGKTSNLSEERARHVEALRMQLEAKSPNRVRLPTDADLDAHRDVLRELWTGDHDPDIGEDVSVLGALGTAHDAILEQWEDALGSVPLLSVRLVEEAVVLLVLGALAVVSAEQWEAALSSESPTPEPGSLVSTVASWTWTAIEGGHSVLGLFPGGEIIYALGLAYGLMAYEWLYYNWFVLSALLFVGAAVLYALDRRLGAVETDRDLFHSRRDVATQVVAALGLVWLAGVLPVVAFGAIDGRVGDVAGGVAGFLAAFVVFAFYVVHGLRRLRVRIEDATDWWHAETPSRLLASYLLARQVWGVLAVVAATLIPIYLLVLVLDGQLWAVLSALAGASTEVLFLLALVVVGAIVLMARAARDAWGDIRVATRTALSERAVRVALFGRGMPFAFMVLAYLLALGIGFSVGVSVLVALLAGILARLAYVAFTRAFYRAQLYEAPDSEVSRLFVEGYTLEDADGGGHYVARLNGERMARGSIDAIVEEVVHQAEHLREHATYDEALGRAHAEQLLEYGFVDEADTRSKLGQEITSTFESELVARGGQARREVVDDELEDYPEDLVAKKRRDLRINGASDWRLVARGDHYLLSR